MRLSTLFCVLLFAAIGCKKDPDFPNTDCIEMEQNPNFTTEDLNEEYTMQFPNDYQGEGLIVDEYAEFLKYSDDVVIKYSFLCPTDCIKFYGGLLDHPIPNFVVGSTIDGITILNQKVEFCKNEMIEALFYHNSADLSFGILYLNVEDQYFESATIQFKKEKLGDVIAILSTLKKS